MKRIVFGVALASLSASCAAQTAEAPSALTVFAAASLRDAFDELGLAYETQFDIRVVVSSDASSVLRAQIEEGAPADVFASADVVNPQALVDARQVDGPVRTFATNALAVVVPAVGGGEVEAWADLARPEVRIIGAGADVPITAYAEQLVENLGEHPDAPPDFAAAYAENVRSREDNVRAVLAKIELGEGDAAIVYETDARASTDVRTVDVPTDRNVLVEYGVVAVTAESAAADFVAWLLGDEAQAILADHGFRPAT